MGARNADALWMLAVVTVIAIVSEFVGGFPGAYSLDRRGASLVGAGTVPCGEVGVVIASPGLAAGVFSPRIDAVIVATSLMTAMITPPICAWQLRRD